jgi:hypothetical protein
MMSRKPLVSMCAVTAMTIGMLATPAGALTRAAPISARQASQDVMATDVCMHDGTISGNVLNKSGDTLRDVKLMIDHAWLWKNEFHPGTNDPSRTDFYTLPQVIPAHGSVAFEYHTNPPLPHRTDGRFDTTVKVMDFTEVPAQQASY